MFDLLFDQSVFAIALCSFPLCPTSTSLRVRQTFLHDALEHDINREVIDSALYGSTSVIESITCHEGCDIDPENKEGATPLHLAISSTFIEDPEARVIVVSELLDSGADTRSVCHPTFRMKIGRLIISCATQKGRPGRLNGVTNS